MEEIEKRLREATDACLAAHAEWDGNQKNGPAREKLQEAVHELRKVAARLEIQIAVSERDDMAAKPLPIPPHRSSRKRPGEMNDLPDDDEGPGNAQPRDNNGGHQESGIARTMGRRRRPGGGGGQTGPFGGGPQGERSSGERSERSGQTPGSGPQPTTGTLSPTGGNRTE